MIEHIKKILLKIGLILLVVFTLGRYKRTNVYNKEKEKLEEEKAKIETEIDNLEGRAEKLKQSSDDREKEIEKIEERINELKERDKHRQEKAEKLNDKLKKLLVLLIIIPCFFSLTATAEEIKDININVPGTYEGLLENYKDLMLITIEYRKLYYQEREDKLEALELAEEMQAKYEAEKKDREEWQELYENMKVQTDRLILIIDTFEEITDELIKMQTTRWSLYGGIGTDRHLQAGISFDF